MNKFLVALILFSAMSNIHAIEVISGTSCQAYKESAMSDSNMILTRSEYGIINRSVSSMVSIFCPLPTVAFKKEISVAVFYKKTDKPTKCWLIASTNIEKGKFNYGGHPNRNTGGIYWLKVKAEKYSTVILKCNLDPGQMIRTIRTGY